MAELYASSAGAPDFRIALLDGVPALDHPVLREAGIVISDSGRLAEVSAPSAHATFIASMLVGRRESALGLCARSQVLVIPVIDEAFNRGSLRPSQVAARLCTGISEAVRQGAGVIQLSLDFLESAERAFREVADVIQWAARFGIWSVLAAGNRPILGLNPLLQATGVVPVSMADRWGGPHRQSPLSPILGKRGLRAPGEDLPGACLPAETCLRSGSSLAASFVSASYALLHSLFPQKGPELIWFALLNPRQRKPSVISPLLDVQSAFTYLSSN
jgi:hypothetical protein